MLFLPRDDHTLPHHATSTFSHNPRISKLHARGSLSLPAHPNKQTPPSLFEEDGARHALELVEHPRGRRHVEPHVLHRPASLSTPLATWYSETMELFARKTNSAAMASREHDDDEGGGEDEEAAHALRRPPSSSMAMRTPRFTSSWWKWGALSSRACVEREGREED